MEDFGSKTAPSIMLLLLSLFLVPVLNTPVSEQELAAKHMRDGTRGPFFNFHQDGENVNIKRSGQETKYESKDNQYNTTAERIEAMELCQSSLILISSTGGFGNSFMEWASALGIAKRLDAVLLHDKKRLIAMENEVVERLKSVFNGVELQSVDEVMTNRRAVLSTGGTSCLNLFPDKDSVLGRRDLDNLERVYYWPKRVAGNKPLALYIPTGFDTAVASVAKTLRTKLSFKKYFHDRAEGKLRSLVEDVKAKANKDEDTKVLVVGMHARATDFTDLLCDIYGKEPADETYFVNALRWMVWTLRTKKSSVTRTFQVKHLPLYSTSLEEKINSFNPEIATPPPHQEVPTVPLIAVAIISDDMEWVNGFIIPAIQQYITSDKVLGVHVFAAGSNDPMVDLALLSQCNHTIISYGTFGVTGAIFSGGMTVVYNLHHYDNFAENMVTFFPHWVLME